MRVFNAEKTQEIFNYDLTNGYLKPDTIFVKNHPEINRVEGVGHYKYKNFPNGGTEREWVWDIAPQERVAAWDEYEEILVYVPFNAEELQNKRISEIKARLSQLSEDFIQSFAGAYIEDIDDRKKEFSNLHNELRALLGKTPRVYF